MSSKLQVRVISPWFAELKTEDAVFSGGIPPEKADALLCHWAPSPELFTFPRAKAWYCSEPPFNFRALQEGTWPRIRSRLAVHEFLWYDHPDPRFRVPHMTHFGELKINPNSDRIERAIAIVSNSGGPPWRRHPNHTYRNRFVTQPEVDLFGRPGWKNYRATWFSRPGPPLNYRGALPGDWPDGTKREMMARYKVAVCFENMYEPYYFTEKFVEAVFAGCIPVYHAHPTVKESVLEGAYWVDPATYGNAPEATLKAALNTDRELVRRQNEGWLANSLGFRATSAEAVFRRIGEILSNPVG